MIVNVYHVRLVVAVEERTEGSGGKEGFLEGAEHFLPLLCVHSCIFVLYATLLEFTQYRNSHLDL